MRLNLLLYKDPDIVEKKYIKSFSSVNANSSLTEELYCPRVMSSEPSPRAFYLFIWIRPR